MPSIRYINQTAPFWDFIASLENNPSQHQNTDREAGPSERPNWAGGWAAPWFHGQLPHHSGPPHPPIPPHAGHPPHPPHPPHHHHGRRRSRGPHHRGPHSPPPPPGFEDENTDNEHGNEKSPDTLMGDNATPGEGAARDVSGDEQISGPEGRRRRGGGCRGRGRRGSPHRDHHHGPGGRHRHGGPPGGFPFRGPWFMERWTEFLNGNNFMNNTTTNNESQDFKPEADVFDTESSYVIHLSLAGAKKEDIGVSYDAEKSELTVSGVLHRPGDEEFLKTLALDERKVGVFERKVRLGSRANPAVVDADMITAKLIDGVLIVDVPKTDKDYVEVRKVDIE